MRAAAVGRQSTYRRQSDSDNAPSRRHKPDYWLLILTLGLLAIGIVVVYSISPALAVSTGTDSGSYVARQLIAIGLGLILFMIAARVPIAAWRRLVPVMLVAAAVATLLALVLPLNEQYPAHRWIRIGGFSFQSVELVKVALIFWLAGFFVARTDKSQIADSKKTFQPFMFVLIGISIVVAGLQSDLGSAVVIAAIMVALAFVSGMPIKRLLIIGAVVIFGGILFIATSDYRQDRFATFVNPEADCTNAGYQACQALIAVGSGGFAGLGLGNSVQAYGYLPEAGNDSIFAIYAEKFGFLGAAVLIGLLLALYARLKRIIDHTPDMFNRLFVLGVLVWLSTQAIMNIGAMIGLLPLKGITLPLISYGGSSVLMVLFALGIVFQISRYTSTVSIAARSGNVNREDNYDNSRYGRRVGRPYYTAPRGGR